MQKMLDFYCNRCFGQFRAPWLQKDAPHRASMGLLAFTLSQIIGMMGIGFLNIFYFLNFPSKNDQKHTISPPKMIKNTKNAQFQSQSLFCKIAVLAKFEPQ